MAHHGQELRLGAVCLLGLGLCEAAFLVGLDPVGNVKVKAVPDNFTVLPAMGDRNGLNPNDGIIWHTNRIFKDTWLHRFG